VDVDAVTVVAAEDVAVDVVRVDVMRTFGCPSPSLDVL
jgi:hypothetical protein